MEDLIAPDLLTVAVDKWPDRVALRSGGDSWSYADLDYAANEIAGRVRSGSRIAFRAEMSVATVATIWGVPRGGGIAVPIDPTLDAASAAELAASLGATLGWPPPEATGPHPMPTPDRPVAIVRTSGTTGHPRGVILTAGNIVAAARASQIHLGSRESDVWLLVMPLHHVAGMAILWRATHDGSQVVLHPKFDPVAASAAMKNDVTWVSLVPTMLHRVLAETTGPWPSVRGALIGGAAAADDLILAALDAGLAALASYGMSETTAQVATVRPGNTAAAIGTVGHPLPGGQVAIDGPAGRPGTISVAGPTVSPGYADEPPRIGPLITNDLGQFDGSGRLMVVGRNDDVVVSGGEKVHPGHVERRLMAHHGVTEAVVVGIPDPEWGQRLVAFVSGQDLDLDELRSYMDDTLERHEIPKLVMPISRMPMLSNGKVDREALRRDAGAM